MPVWGHKHSYCCIVKFVFLFGNVVTHCVFVGKVHRHYITYSKLGIYYMCRSLRVNLISYFRKGTMFKKNKAI